MKPRVVSLAAVFWMSRNAPHSFGGALRDVQKTAARETKQIIGRGHALMLDIPQEKMRACSPDKVVFVVTV